MRLEGEIHEIELISQLVELGRERFTGAVRFERDSIIKIVYLKDGDIVSASTNDRSDSLDEILLKAGKVSREHIKQALAKRKDSETLGDALFSLGFISRKELSWARRVQLVGILRSITGWTDGSFQLVPDYLPKREEGTLFHLPQIIIELIVTETDRAKIEEALSSTVVLQKSPNFRSAYSELNLNDEADEIVGHVDGNRTVSDIASESKSDAFSVFKLLHALRTLDLLVPAEAEVKHEVLGGAAATVAPLSPYSGSPEPPLHFDEPEIPSVVLPVGKVDFDPSLLEDSFPGVTAASQSSTTPLAVPTSASGRRAGTPNYSRPARRSRKGMYAVLALVIIAAAGVGGWMWSQQTEEPPVAVAAPARPRAVTPPVDTPAETSSAVATTTDGGSSIAVGPPANSLETSPASTTTAAEARPVTPPVAAAPPTPAPPAAASSFRARAAEYVRTADRTKFALQFEVVCQDESVRRAVAEGGDAVWFVPAAVGGRSCYRVFWGTYATREQAARSAGEIPRSLRSGTPVPVAIGKVLP